MNEEEEMYLPEPTTFEIPGRRGRGGATATIHWKPRPKKGLPPALIELIRLLARQAAEETLRGEAQIGIAYLPACDDPVDGWDVAQVQRTMGSSRRRQARAKRKISEPT